MDQQPGQNVGLGLCFHMEGPVSPKIKLKNQFWAEKTSKFQKKIFEKSTETSLGLQDQACPGLTNFVSGFFKSWVGGAGLPLANN